MATITSIVWGNVARQITQGYNPATHRGIDIGDVYPANAGMAVDTPLFAARAGTVSRVGYGFLAIAITGTNQTDWYLHIDYAVVQVGQTVNRGQHVAYSDTKQVSGGPVPTGPHLHFEVQTGNLDVAATSLDPVPVLLTGLYGSGGGSLGGDLTDTEIRWAHDISELVAFGSVDTSAQSYADYAWALNHGSTIQSILAGWRASAGGQAWAARLANASAGTPGVKGLDGKDGAPGLNGIDGKDGAPGKDGIDGLNAPAPSDSQIASAVKAIFTRIIGGA